MAEEVTDLIVREQGQLASWGGAAERGLAARQEREAIVKSVLKADIDFGTIPGTPKPTLLKPGAEKITDSLNLYPDYEAFGRLIEDWDRPLFAYTYRCTLRLRGSDHAIATGIGSCNSMENRYRWRKVGRLCPDCDGEFIIKGKKEFGGGWLCWQKKGGCGAKFKDGDERIEAQVETKVPNEDIYTQVNTINKMAQKRSLVAAVLNLGFSEHFTQDLEDGVLGEDSGQVEAASQTGTVRPPQRKGGRKSDTKALSWLGTIKEITIKTGKKSSGEAWTLYTIHGSDGERFGTFSESLAKEAGEACEAQIECCITYEKTQKGGKNVQTVEIVGA